LNKDYSLPFLGPSVDARLLAVHAVTSCSRLSVTECFHFLHFSTVQAFAENTVEFWSNGHVDFTGGYRQHYAYYYRVGEPQKDTGVLNTLAFISCDGWSVTMVVLNGLTDFPGFFCAGIINLGWLRRN
jgi:hypothetical protein